MSIQVATLIAYCSVMSVRAHRQIASYGLSLDKNSDLAKHDVQFYSWYQSCNLLIWWQEVFVVIFQTKTYLASARCWEKEPRIVVSVEHQDMQHAHRQICMLLPSHCHCCQDGSASTGDESNPRAFSLMPSRD